MNFIHTVFFAVAMASSPFSVFAGDPVDLRDKEGIVDPKDLKKDDPKEPSLPIKEPPPPLPKPAVPLFEVDRGGIDDASRPIENE